MPITCDAIRVHKKWFTVASPKQRLRAKDLFDGVAQGFRTPAHAVIVRFIKFCTCLDEAAGAEKLEPMSHVR
jgi:hypothetical protein